ncbi:MAG: hypothetical protein GY796_19875 [Chloroflexi bacterium]|nr:hypothetical protein [Chloroflexota bacterium]
MTQTVSEQQIQEAAGQTWWIFLLQGIATLIIGFLLLASTARTLVVLIGIMGIYWIITGIFNIVAALAGHVTEHKWLVVISGVISIIAGIVVLDHMIWSAVIVPTLAVIIMGIAALINGIVTIIAGRSKGDHRERSWAGFFLGLLYILFGILLLANPLLGAVSLVLVIAIWGIVGGIVLIVLAFRVKKLAPA